MVDVQAYIDAFKAILPVQIQDFWYIVILIAILILLLIFINIGKLFRKKQNPQVEAFKAQNPSGMPPANPRAAQRPPAVSAAHHQVMVQHNVHAPHDNYKQLTQFVKAQMDANFDLNMIRRNLLSVGWDPNVIEDAIAAVRRQREEATK